MVEIDEIIEWENLRRFNNLKFFSSNNKVSFSYFQNIDQFYMNC